MTSARANDYHKVSEDPKSVRNKVKVSMTTGTICKHRELKGTKNRVYIAFQVDHCERCRLERGQCMLSVSSYGQGGGIYMRSFLLMTQGVYVSYQWSS